MRSSPVPRHHDELPNPLMEGSSWCSWGMSSSDMRAYHDLEWGMPTVDDRQLFEKICLEGFQCGLSWSTVLRKRARLREVFANFEASELVRFSARDLDRIALDSTIIRHRGKIASVVSNARACLDLVEDVGSLGAYLWSFADQAEKEPAGDRPPATSEASIRLSKDLKKRGWSFVGPTTMYAMMQSVGMVNDHDRSCPSRTVVSEARSNIDWISIWRN